MSDSPQGEGWWLASDGKWYPPQSQSQTHPAPPPAGKPWWKKKRYIIPLVLVVLFAIASAAGGGEENTAVPSAGTGAPAGGNDKASTTSAPSAAYGNQPPAEVAFVQAVQVGQSASKAADNDLQRGAAKSTRDAAVCAALPSKEVSGWTGKLTTVDANNDGKGILTIEIAKDVKVSTWNNALSDIGDKTLIDQNTPLFQSALGVKKGQVVTFGGSFIDAPDECIREQSFTLTGKLQTPTYVFRFASIAPAS